MHANADRIIINKSSAIDVILLALGVFVAAINIHSLVIIVDYAISGGPIVLDGLGLLGLTSTFAQPAAGIALLFVVYYRRKNRKQLANRKSTPV